MRASNVVTLIILLCSLSGCGSDDASPQQGVVGGFCYPNGTCNAQLMCVDGLCVPLGDAAADVANSPDPDGVADGRDTPDSPGETDVEAGGNGIKVDFLWVIDNSASMCRAKHNLARNFADFSDVVARGLELDQRHAVTTHDAHCQPNGTSISSARGLFNTRPATSFPPACQFRSRVLCRVDADCAATIDATRDWDCQPALSESCETTPNGSINSSCRLQCASDQDCQSHFGESGYICQKPSSSESHWGCILPPMTADCPETVPSVVDADSLDLFACNATVGANQERCFKFEQGMRSAMMALDRSGPNAAQAIAFLRDDAYLAIIFVTDEDDCSVVDDNLVDENHYQTCAQTLRTTDEGGPLVPVDHYISAYKALKSDPSQVFVAAIAGDSLGLDDVDVSADRASYIEAKTDPRSCYDTSYICDSINGTADFAQRYLQLIDGFGANGVFANYCDPAGIGGGLQHIASRLRDVIGSD